VHAGERDLEKCGLIDVAIHPLPASIHGDQSEQFRRSISSIKSSLDNNNTNTDIYIYIYIYIYTYIIAIDGLLYYSIVLNTTSTTTATTATTTTPNTITIVIKVSIPISYCPTTHDKGASSCVSREIADVYYLEKFKTAEGSCKVFNWVLLLY